MLHKRTLTSTTRHPAPLLHKTMYILTTMSLTRMDHFGYITSKRTTHSLLTTRSVPRRSTLTTRPPRQQIAARRILRRHHPQPQQASSRSQLSRTAARPHSTAKPSSRQTDPNHSTTILRGTNNDIHALFFLTDNSSQLSLQQHVHYQLSPLSSTQSQQGVLQNGLSCPSHAIIMIREPPPQRKESSKSRKRQSQIRYQ